MEWKIQDSNCWICNGTEKITQHHTLPKHWKPRNNIIVPICQKCHDRLNQEDLSGMMQFVTKIEHELGRQLGLWGTIRNSLAKYTEFQDKLVEAFKKNEKVEK